MAEILSMVSGVSFALAGIFLVLAVFFWFKFGVPGIIGDLSGRTARKSIAKIRENNEKSGRKTYRPSSINMARGKLTEQIKGTGRMGQGGPMAGDISGRNGKGEAPKATALLEAAETGGPTMPLEIGETEPLLGKERQTGYREKALPDANTALRAAGWEILGSVIFIHTEEVID